MKIENGKMKKYKLGEIATIQTGPFGSQLHNEDYVIKGTPIVTVEHLGNKYFITQNLPLVSDEDKERLKKYLLKENDIVFSRVGAVDRCSFVSEKENGWLFSGRCLRVRPNKEVVNSQWLYYFFTQQHFKEYVRSKAVGCTMPSLNTDLLSDLIITTPPLESQQKIAAVLSSLDDKIALNRRMNAKLEQMAKRLYNHWFVQFDFPNADGKPYKSSGGKMEYNEVLKREIPDEWEVKKLGDVCEIVLGGTPSTANNEFWDNGTISWLNSGEVGIFPIVESEKKITEIAVEKSTTEFLKAGSVTLSITRYLRPSILAIDACINQSVVGIKENDLFKNCFLYPYLQNEIDRLMSLRTGAQQPHINKEIVEDSFINIPPKELMEKYKKKVTPIYLQIINIAKETQKLTVLRDRLLPLLMNGQVEVR